MANPISPNPTAALPPFSLPMVDLINGNPSFVWYQFFLSAYNKLGGQQGLDLSTVKALAEAALAAANEAETVAIAANSTATAAEGIANQANTTANSALNVAGTGVALAQAVQRSSLQAANNLSDLTTVSFARSNLGVSSYSLIQTWDGQPNDGQMRYIPINRGYTVPANFAGSAIHCGTYATVDAPFVIGYIRSGATHTIGSVTLVHAGNFTHTTTQSAVSLQAGDVITVKAPSPQDATLADVGLSLILTLA